MKTPLFSYAITAGTLPAWWCGIPTLIDRINNSYTHTDQQDNSSAVILGGGGGRALMDAVEFLYRRNRTLWPKRRGLCTSLRQWPKPKSKSFPHWLCNDRPGDMGLLRGTERMKGLRDGSWQKSLRFLHGGFRLAGQS